MAIRRRNYIFFSFAPQNIQNRHRTAAMFLFFTFIIRALFSIGCVAIHFKRFIFNFISTHRRMLFKHSSVKLISTQRGLVVVHFVTQSNLKSGFRRILNLTSIFLSTISAHALTSSSRIFNCLIKNQPKILYVPFDIPYRKIVQARCKECFTHIYLPAVITACMFDNLLVHRTTGRIR